MHHSTYGIFVNIPVVDHWLERKRKKKEKKVMCYLTRNSTHLIYDYAVKDHSDNERGNPL